MSRGPGRIERAIHALFDAHPDLAFVTDELAEHCYPDARPISASIRWRCCVRRRRWWRLIRIGPHGESKARAAVGYSSIMPICRAMSLN